MAITKKALLTIKKDFADVSGNYMAVKFYTVPDV